MKNNDDCDIDKQRPRYVCIICLEDLTMCYDADNQAWYLGCNNFKNHKDVKPQTDFDNIIEFKCQ